MLSKEIRPMTEDEYQFLKTQLRINYDGNGKQRREFNIIQLNAIVQKYKDEQLKTFEKEAQIKIATTTWGEACYYKFPGRESLRSGSAHCPYDFRPICLYSQYTELALKDPTADDVFRAMAVLVDRYPHYRDILVGIFVPLENMQSEKKTIDTEVEIIVPDKYWAKAMQAGQSISYLYHRDYTVINKYVHHLELYLPDHPIECWKILNETISMDGTVFEGFSIQMFFYIAAGIALNEDSKMSYLGKNNLLNNNKKDVYTGCSNTIRNMFANTCLTYGKMSATDVQTVIENSARNDMHVIPLYAIQNMAPDILVISNDMLMEDIKRFTVSKEKDILPAGTWTMTRRATKKYSKVSATIVALHNKCILKAGSYISKNVKDDIPKMAALLRSRITLDENGMICEDIVIESIKPSCVATIVAGHSVSALDSWKTEDGVTLRQTTNTLAD